jgi:hypothetical protein
MERIRIFRMPKGLNRFFIIAGFLSIVFGMILFLHSLQIGFRTAFWGGDWNNVIFILQGIFFFFVGYSNIRYEKYFIEWDDIELRYLLPPNKVAEIIKISDIRTIEIKFIEIRLQLPEGTKTLNLENFHFKELKRIKERFEEIKIKMDKQ